jgi:DNA-binding transcriptional ArsR family regulator
MPVDFESYHLNDLPDEGTNGRRILEHLAQHSELGFTPSELADELDIPRGSVGTTLSRLDERGVVRLMVSIGRSISRRTTLKQPVRSACGQLLTDSRAITTGQVRRSLRGPLFGQSSETDHRTMPS